MQLKYPAQKITQPYTRVVGPGMDGLRWIDFGLLQLSSGGVWNGETGGREAVFLLQEGSGTVEVVITGKASIRLSFGPRRDLFADKASLVYLPPGVKFKFHAGDAGVSGPLIYAGAKGNGEPYLVTPGQITPRQVGRDNWQRTVCLGTVPECNAKRLIVGETFNPPGNWSSYPPHKHDCHIPGVESPLEEVYSYRFSPANGFALQRIYETAGAADRLDRAFVVEEGDTMILPRGYHPVAAAPGYRLYYLWILAGETLSYGAWSDDPAHCWLVRG